MSVTFDRITTMCSIGFLTLQRILKVQKNLLPLYEQQIQTSLQHLLEHLQNKLFKGGYVFFSLSHSLLFSILFYFPKT